MMSSIDEENQLSQVSTIGQSSASGNNNDDSAEEELTGYHALANLMARAPTMGVFRRFGKLNAFNLLFYQAELMKLEKEFLAQLECDEKSEDPHRRELARNWNAASATDAQWQSISKIRPIMEKYNEQLLAQHHLVKMLKPDSRDMDYLKAFIEREDMGNIQLKGLERNVWTKAPMPELVALDATESEDNLTEWAGGILTDLWHVLIGRHIGKPSKDPTLKNSKFYSFDSIARVVSVLIIGLSSIFPISSIILLDHFEGQRTRLMILCIYTVAFSITLAAVSGAKRIEVFSASAAFAAVQVVFISQDKKNRGGGT